jgi:hypothetical protein
MSWFRTSLRTLVMLFVLVTVNSCLHRDPWVDLGNGYAIGACAWSEPCSLMYYRPGDKRPCTEWYADRFDGTFVLHRESGSAHETLEFKSEAEWRQAWREKNAAPGSHVLPALENVTGFSQEGRLVIGQYDSGYFLLDTNADTVEQWSDRAAWESAVSTRTGINTVNLHNPKSYWVQSRPPALYGVLAVITLLMTPWVLAPLWRRRNPAVPQPAPALEANRIT